MLCDYLTIETASWTVGSGFLGGEQVGVNREAARDASRGGEQISRLGAKKWVNLVELAGRMWADLEDLET